MPHCVVPCGQTHWHVSGSNVASGSHRMQRRVLLHRFSPGRQAHLPVSGGQKKSQHSKLARHAARPFGTGGRASLTRADERAHLRRR